MRWTYKYTIKNIICFSLDPTSLETFCREAENLLGEYASELETETKKRSKWWNSVDYFKISNIKQSHTQSINLDKEIHYRNILLNCEYPYSWEEKVSQQLSDKLKPLGENYKNTLDYIIEHFSISKELNKRKIEEE